MIQLLGLLLIIIALKLVVVNSNSPMAMSFNSLVASIIVREDAAAIANAPAFA